MRINLNADGQKHLLTLADVEEGQLYEALNGALFQKKENGKVICIQDMAGGLALTNSYCLSKTEPIRQVFNYIEGFEW